MIRFKQRYLYAMHVLPVLDHSRKLFDQAASAVSGASGLDAMNTACEQYQNEVPIDLSYADGVPHPFAWYSAAGALHHQVLGVYHDMAGALTSCQNAFGAGDDGAGAQAAADVRTADEEMRQVDDYARWLVQHP